MATFYLKHGDRAPLIRTTLKNPDDSIYDLTRATTVEIVVRKMGASADLVNTAATIFDAAGGIVQYQFADGETDIPGFYRVEWIVDAGLSTEETFPNYDYDGLYIERGV